jgi:penicillin-binding protein 1A
VSPLLWSTPRRRVAVVLAVLALAALAAAGAAWFASPPASGLGARVEAALGATSGRPVSVGRLPAILREAVVATEDERFYRHHGIDLIGVARALPYDLMHLSLAQGASTITEQVAKVLYLGGNDHSPWRKLEDAVLAVKLENRYSKRAILDAYLNSAYFGEGAVGVRAASERYFGIPPSRLDVAQASLLAGLIQAPSLYDPLRRPRLARGRQVEVLRSLVREGLLTEKSAAAVLDRALPLGRRGALPAMRGVDLAPGPAFVWSQLGLGAATALLGIGAMALALLFGPRGLRLRLTIRLLALVLVVLGSATIVRSFRSA